MDIVKTSRFIYWRPRVDLKCHYRCAIDVVVILCITTHLKHFLLRRNVHYSTFFPRGHVTVAESTRAAALVCRNELSGQRLAHQVRVTTERCLHPLSPVTLYTDHRTVSTPIVSRDTIHCPTHTEYAVVDLRSVGDVALNSSLRKKY